MTDPLRFLTATPLEMTEAILGWVCAAPGRSLKWDGDEWRLLRHDGSEYVHGPTLGVLGSAVMVIGGERG